MSVVWKRREAVTSALVEASKKQALDACSPPPPTPCLLILLDGKYHQDTDFLTNKNRGPAKVKELCKRQMGAL